MAYCGAVAIRVPMAVRLDIDRLQGGKGILDYMHLKEEQDGRVKYHHSPVFSVFGMLSRTLPRVVSYATIA